MQEKTIKSYQDEYVRLQLIQLSDKETHRLFYVIRENRRQIRRFASIVNACKAFQMEINMRVMQTQMLDLL